MYRLCKFVWIGCNRNSVVQHVNFEVSICSTYYFNSRHSVWLTNKEGIVSDSLSHLLTVEKFSVSLVISLASCQSSAWFFGSIDTGWSPLCSSVRIRLDLARAVYTFNVYEEWSRSTITILYFWFYITVYLTIINTTITHIHSSTHTFTRTPCYDFHILAVR